ncbi:MAG: PH domain-containing protein [Dehalococcoidia bacterium]|nr:PH domain-containing protein [Dehalococcoidia bacterium]
MTSPPRQSTRRFPTKVDWWVLVCIVSGPLVAGAAAVGSLLSDDIAAMVVSWVMLVGVGLLYVAVVWPVYYEVDGETLLVRFGMIRSRTPLNDVVRIRRSRNLLSSPAMSLDRLQIDRRGGGFFLLSPADKAGFIAAIREGNPNVTIDPEVGSYAPAHVGQWSAQPPSGSHAEPRRVDERMERTKDGRSWRIGGPDEVAWIAEGTVKHGVAVTVAIPPVFEAYATCYPPGKPPVPTMVHEQTLVDHLVAHTPDQPWWLGYLDTGAHDVVFDDAPMVSLYFDWNYVLVQAGPEQALTWRTGHTRAGLNEGALPDLFFPADRSWLVSGLWDDLWTCIGGSAALIDALHRDPAVAARIIGPDDDRKPPELPRY